jgi:hypothetical protein
MRAPKRGDAKALSHICSSFYRVKPNEMAHGPERNPITIVEAIPQETGGLGVGPNPAVIEKSLVKTQ